MPTTGLGCGRWGRTSKHGGLESSPGRRLNKGLEGIGLLGVLGQVFQEQGCVGCGVCGVHEGCVDRVWGGVPNREAVAVCPVRATTGTPGTGLRCKCAGTDLQVPGPFTLLVPMR